MEAGYMEAHAHFGVLERAWTVRRPAKDTESLAMMEHRREGASREDLPIDPRVLSDLPSNVQIRHRPHVQQLKVGSKYGRTEQDIVPGVCTHYWFTSELQLFVSQYVPPAGSYILVCAAAGMAQRVSVYDTHGLWIQGYWKVNGHAAKSAKWEPFGGGSLLISTELRAFQVIAFGFDREAVVSFGANLLEG